MMTSINTPLVSIIVPVYNVEDYLDACLNSIKQQTYEHLEIIVIEDGSIDNSQQVLKAHLKDCRIQLINHDKNSGLSAARNTGIKAASGDYMMFVDSDDIIDLRVVETCLHCTLEANADVVLLSVKPFQNGSVVQTASTLTTQLPTYQSMTQKDYFEYAHFAWLKFMRSDVIRDHNLQFPIDHYYEDWPFHWRVGFVAARIVKADSAYYYYRQRRDSITGLNDQKLLHIFASHCLVAGITDQYLASIEIRSLLSKKIYKGIWFVLTTIDRQYLEEAAVEAKHHLSVTRHYLNYSTAHPKVRLLLLSLQLPLPLAVLAIAGVRAGLNQLSPARRRQARG